MSTLTSITATERKQLAEWEDTIERNKSGFIETAKALINVRDTFKHRFPDIGYKNFEAYCAERWGFSRFQAHRLIVAGVIVNLLPIGNKPETESQARPLASLKDKAQQQEAWKTAVAASGGKPTAKQVAAVVDEVKAKHDLTGVRPIPEIKLSAADAAAVEQAGKDSGELWLLKYHWRQATKKERLDAMQYFADEANDKDSAAYRACWKEKP